MSTISTEDFVDKVDSLYRLVIVAARRAAQIAKPDTRALISFDFKTRRPKPTIIALEEIRQSKVGYKIGTGDEEAFVE